MSRSFPASGIEWVHRIAPVLALLMMFASGAGLTVQDLYRDNALVTAGWRGNDLVTLLVAVPLLAVAAWASWRGRPRALLVLFGMLLYTFYSYSFYLFGAAFNALFLVYVAIVTLSGVGLLLGLIHWERSQGSWDVRLTTSTRAVAAFLLVVGALLGTFWVALSLGYLFTGDPPAMVAATSHPTNVTGALDLSLVVTPALVAGVLLWRGRFWGYVLGVMWSVKGAVYMMALSGATISAYRADVGADLAQLALWGPIGAGSFMAAGVLLRQVVHYK